MRSRLLATIALTGATAAFASAQQADQPKPEATAQEEAKPAMTAEKANSPLDFEVEDINGQRVPLSRYKGKVVLMVNVASRCGLTPQYAQLESLHEKYGEQGLAVLGFPANDFRQQEPGTNAEIKEFCTSKYNVKFDLFAKVCVKGENCCELYRYLTSADKNKDFAGPIQWNFTKFLVGRDGKVIARFEPKTAPDDPQVVAAIEAALKH